MIYVKGQKIEVPFYIVEGNGFLLLGNNLVRNARILNDKNLVIIPRNNQAVNNTALYLPTYHCEENRTRLQSVPSTSECLPAYFDSVRSLKSIHFQSPTEIVLRDDDYCKGFAYNWINLCEHSTIMFT